MRRCASSEGALPTSLDSALLEVGSTRHPSAEAPPAIVPLLHNRNLSTLWRVVRLWTLVLAANIAGTWMFAAVAAHSSVSGPEAKQAFSEISAHALSASFGTTLLRAVFAGWLIALMVWLLPGAEGSRPFIIVVITYVVSLAGFSHILAGSVDYLFFVETGQTTWLEFNRRFLSRPWQYSGRCRTRCRS
jgi:formate-nitrite transporter family protein